MIGLAIYMVFRSTMALGANLQRYSMRRELEKPEEDRLPLKKQRLLYMGVIVYAGSGILLSTALIFASPTLLSPCGTIIFVANAFFATKLNKEPFSWRLDGGCIFMIICGSIAVVLSAPKDDDDFDTEKLIWLCKQPSFISFLVVLMLLILAMWKAERLLGCRGRDVQASRWKRSALHISRGALAGGLGALNITFTKSIFSLIQGQIDSGGFVSVLKSPLLWVVGLLLAGSYVAQMTATTKGLKRTPAMVFVPAQSVTEETCAGLGGLFYFQDYLKFTPVRAVVYTFGVAATIAAVVLLARIQIARQGIAADGGSGGLLTDRLVMEEDADEIVREPIHIPVRTSRTSIESIGSEGAQTRVNRSLLSSESDHEPFRVL